MTREAMRRTASAAAAAALLAMATATGPTASAAADDTTARQTVLDWNHAAVNGAKMFQNEAFVYLAYVQAAVYDAVTAIEGGYRQYGTSLEAPPSASVSAAVATAAHDTLSAYLPAQQPSFDAAYAASLAAVPDGAAKADGIAVGADAASAIVALRAHDGRNAPVSYPGSLDVGAWRPTRPAFLPAQTPWIAQLTPFVLPSPSLFRPGPPPKLTSPTYARDLNEIQQLGSATSTVRTPEQTAVARFWSTNSNIEYNGGFTRVAVSRGLDAEDTARLLAMGNVVAADAAIACWDAKYTYGLWRPVTAIQNADLDGNPATTADPSWQPLLTTPNHPEYVAAHGCLTSAEADVFSEVLGTSKIDIDLASTVTGTTRHFASAQDMKREIVNARVWGGLHYRTSAERGVHLGDQVASYDLDHAFLPV
jgi:hypothetical protein